MEEFFPWDSTIGLSVGVSNNQGFEKSGVKLQY